jgi:DNA-binding MltR family transcriptional regulator
MWFPNDEKTFKAIKELEASGDRTYGILAATIIDSLLNDLIRQALHGDDSDYSKKVRKDMFHADRPLGAFGAKINMAYLMGFVSADAHADLQNMKNIRNLFAHYREHATFVDQRIEALCANFKLVNRHVTGPIRFEPIADERRDEGFETSAFMYGMEGLRLCTPDAAEILTTARGRFTGTAQLLCYVLTCLVGSKPNPADGPKIVLPMI